MTASAWGGVSPSPGRGGACSSATVADMPWGHGLVLAALALARVLLHPLGGIEGDSRIYMGRALADLDPAGVGRDMMFTLDGQSGFTLYGTVARTLAAAIGLYPASLVLTFLNLLVWFAAAAVLARALTKDRGTALLILAAICVLPLVYAPWHLIGAGESIPQPRPIAEAGVMLALAALCAGRVWSCLACLVAAALFHPIMAAPGFGVLLVVLGQRDRRWFVGAAILGVLVVAAALAGAPVASRLLATIDPVWRSILIGRNPYLFLREWPAEMLGPMIVRGATLLLACLVLTPPIRRIVVASCIVAALGLAASFLFGDLLHDLLVVQAQLWRTLWLPSVFAAAAAGLCLAHLPRQGPAGRIALAFLALAWIRLDDPVIAPIAACLAVAACLGLPRLSFAVTRRIIVAVWLCCGGLSAIDLWQSVQAVIVMAGQAPGGQRVAWPMICSLHLLAVPILGLTFAWWLWGATRLGRRLAVAMAVLAMEGVLLVTQWDQRPPGPADPTAVHPDLVAMMASRQGEVLWLEGDDAWYWLRRANWNAQIQGSSIVFSRAQALLWEARARDVVTAGLASPYLLTPMRAPMERAAPLLDAAKIEAFCGGADRPAWIAAPLDPGTAVPGVLHAAIWSPRAPRSRSVTDGDTIHWRVFDRFAIIPCSDAPAGAARVR